MNKVSHVITTIMRGGAENQLVEVARQQVLIGWEVRIIFLKGEPELSESFERIGASVESGISNKPVVFQLLKLRKLLANTPSVVHAHLPRAELFCAIAVRRNKFVFTRHNSEPFFPSGPRFLSVILSRFVCSRAESGIAITSAVKEYLTSSREVKSSYSLQVVHYGYTPTFNQDENSESHFGTKSGSSPLLRLVTVGRLVPQKDQQTLIKSLAILQQSNQAVELTIIGEGVLRQELINLAIKLKVDNLINFLGRINNPIEEIVKHNVFVLPSIYEGFGLVLLEAMDSALPIIAADNTCIPEVLGTAGLLFKTGSASDLAEKIKEMTNSTLRDNQSKLSRIRLKDFSPEIMCKRLIEIYETSEK